MMLSLPNPYVLLGGVCGAALLFVSGFGLGHHQKTLEDASAALAGAHKTIAVIGKQEAITSAIGGAVAVQLAKIQTVTQTLIQRVPYAVPKATACPVSVAALSVLNDAAAGSVSDAAGKPDGSPSGVDTSDEAANYVLNAGQFNEVRAQLIGLQDWVSEQKSLAEKH